MSSTGEPQLTDREELETSLIRALIASYFSIVRLTIQDLVPKAIMRASSLPSLELVEACRADAVQLVDLLARRPPRQLFARERAEPARREPVQGLAL